MTKQRLIKLIIKHFGKTIEEMKKEGIIEKDDKEYDHLKGEIDLQNLNFEGWSVFVSNMTAKEIYNDNQKADMISNAIQEGVNIVNNFQKADNIENLNQTGKRINNDGQKGLKFITNLDQKAKKIHT